MHNTLKILFIDWVTVGVLVAPKTLVKPPRILDALVAGIVSWHCCGDDRL